jgi:hypothetical protein
MWGPPVIPFCLSSPFPLSRSTYVLRPRARRMGRAHRAGPRDEPRPKSLEPPREGEPRCFQSTVWSSHKTTTHARHRLNNNQKSAKEWASPAERHLQERSDDNVTIVRPSPRGQTRSSPGRSTGFGGHDDALSRLSYKARLGFHWMPPKPPTLHQRTLRSRR